MNKKNFSDFIVNLRKEYNMTQQELADKLFVTDKAISKWERGISLPDITMYEKISKIFNVSVAELIKGERIENNQTSLEYDNILINTINEEKNHNRIKNKKFVIVCLIINFLILLFLVIFFFKNYNNVVAYNFSGYSKNFNFYIGNVIYSNNQNNFISIDGFLLNDDSSLNLYTLKSIDFNVYFDGEMWQSFSYYAPNDMDKINIYDWVKKDVSFKETHITEMDDEHKKNIDELLNRYNNYDNFLKSNKNEFPDNFKIEVKYCDYNNICETENFNIISRVIVKNNFLN